jgi:NUBPL iron-transfer P-loop NTPase
MRSRVMVRVVITLLWKVILGGRSLDKQMLTQWFLPPSQQPQGGVGKSTVAVNLAYELSRQGGRIGLLDLDLYGPSLPILVRPEDVTIRRSPLGTGMVYPIDHHNVKLLSLGFVNMNVSLPPKKFELPISPLLSMLSHMLCVYRFSASFLSSYSNQSGVPGSGQGNGATIMKGPMAVKVVSQL